MRGTVEQGPQLSREVPFRCPYTASSCPLFNPTFSVADAMTAVPPAEALSPAPDSPGQTLQVAKPPLGLVDSMRNAYAASSANTIDGTIANSAPAYSYQDCAIAPSPDPSASTASGSFSPPTPEPLRPFSGTLASPSSVKSRPSAYGNPYPTLPFSGRNGICLPSIDPLAANSHAFDAAAVASAHQLPPARSTYSPTLAAQGVVVPGGSPTFAPQSRYSYERHRSGPDDESGSGLSACLLPSPTGGAVARGSGCGFSGPSSGLKLQFAPGGAVVMGSNGMYGLPGIGSIPAQQQQRQAPSSCGPPPVSLDMPGSSRAAYPPAYGSQTGLSFATSAGLYDTDTAAEGEFEEDGDEEHDDERDEDYVESVQPPSKRARQARGISTLPLVASGCLPGFGAPSGSAMLPSPPAPASASASPPDGPAGSATPFISKLHHALGNPAHADVIRWSADGSSILFQHTSPRLLETLGKFFRHTSATSFARQLNIYDFRRLSVADLLVELERLPGPSSASEWSGFTHPGFWRDGAGRAPCDLGALKPQGPKTERGKANLAKKVAGGGRKRKKAAGRHGGKVGGVKKGGLE